MLINILIYVQQDATLHSLFISGNCSTCFGWYHHPSSGAQNTVSTASGICHTVTAICRYRVRVGTGLSVLWVAYRSKGYPQRNAAHMGSISLWISFAASIFLAHKKRTTPRCSIVVHVFRGAAIL